MSEFKDDFYNPEELTIHPLPVTQSQLNKVQDYNSAYESPQSDTEAAAFDELQRRMKKTIRGLPSMRSPKTTKPAEEPSTSQNVNNTTALFQILLELGPSTTTDEH